MLKLIKGKASPEKMGRKSDLPFDEKYNIEVNKKYISKLEDEITGLKRVIKKLKAKNKILETKVSKMEKEDDDHNESSDESY